MPCSMFAWTYMQYIQSLLLCHVMSVANASVKLQGCCCRVSRALQTRSAATMSWAECVAGEYEKAGQPGQAKATNSMLRFLQQLPCDRQPKVEKDTFPDCYHQSSCFDQDERAVSSTCPVKAGHQRHREHAGLQASTAVQQEGLHKGLPARLHPPAQAPKRRKIGPLDSFVLKR